MPDLPIPDFGNYLQDQSETVSWTRPSIQIIEEASGLFLWFVAPGDIQLSGTDNIHIQPGSYSIVTTADNTRLVQFQASYRRGAEEVEMEIFENVNKFNRLMYTANRVSKGDMPFRRVVARTQKKYDGDGYLESVVLNGAIQEIDTTVISRWYDKNTILYQVQIELAPYAERPDFSYSFENVSCHGGVVNLGRFGSRGTTGGRIRTLTIYPSKESNYQWRNLWIGIKPNMTIDGDDINIFSQIRISPNTASNIDTSNPLMRPILSSPELINDDGVIVDFANGNTGWLPRFYVPSSIWTTNAGSYFDNMPGMYRLLGRIKMSFGTDTGDDRGRTSGLVLNGGIYRYGVRTRLVYEWGNLGSYELSRTPEIIIPDERMGDGNNPAYYDLGDIKIGGDYYQQSRQDISSLSVSVDSALLYGEQTELTEGNLIFDDFRLVPLDSFLRVSLPQKIKSIERLDIYFDDADKPHAVVQLTGTGSIRPLRYEVSDIEAGPNGFTMPPFDYNQMVIVADAGPDEPISTSATISKVEMVFKPREHGGML